MVGASHRLVEQFAATAQRVAQGAVQSQAGGEAAGQAETPDPEVPGLDGAAPPARAHTVSFGNGKAHIVFGYTLRMGRDGISAERFGNTPPLGKTSVSSGATRPDKGAEAAVLLPIVDVFEDGDLVVVVAELPGVDPDRIVCRVDGLELLIEATGMLTYRKTLTLPVSVRSDGRVRSFRNGILEVRLPRANPA